MAFRRRGEAQVAHVDMRRGDWLDYLSDQGKRSKVARSAPATAENLTDQVSGILGRKFDPGEFVLTHATLVASVDNYAPKSAKVGRMDVGGVPVNCPYPDYRISAKTQKYINNNNDSFSRGTLLKSYRTLIGGHIFCEHVQIEALSKGRIFDAVARDVGDSIYVDILAGTHVSHEDLCKGILAGIVAKMSMGCDIAGAQCCKCGNWSADDTTICPDIQYYKGDVFQDEDGNPHRIAELCGHESLQGGGVTFKEGSWVEMPAFEGAVARNLVRLPGARQLPAVPADLRTLVAGSWLPIEASRTASVRAQDPVEFEEGSSGGDGGEEEDSKGDEGGGGPPAPPKKNDSSLDDTVTEVEQYVLDRALDRVRKRMKTDELDHAIPLSTSPNESIQRQGSAYAAALRQIAAKTRSPVRRLLALHHLNEAFSVTVPRSVYRSAAAAVKSGRTASVSDFISSCLTGAGSAPTPSEARTIVRVARFLLRGDA